MFERPVAEADLRLAAVLRALISVGTALHLTGPGMDRLSRCALTECRLPFGDFTRGGRQRYCSPACASRDAARRHREPLTYSRRVPRRGPDTPTGVAAESTRR